MIQNSVSFDESLIINIDISNSCIRKHVHEYTNSFKADLRDQMKLIHDKISPDNKT